MPNPNDSTVLEQALSVVSEAQGSTFIVEPGNFELLSFQSCAIEWDNLDSKAHEYCWDELVSYRIVSSSYYIYYFFFEKR